MPEPQQQQIQTMSANYTTAHGNAGSLTHWTRPGIEPTASWFLVGFISTVLWQELPGCGILMEKIPISTPRDEGLAHAGATLPSWATRINGRLPCKDLCIKMIPILPRFSLLQEFFRTPEKSNLNIFNTLGCLFLPSRTQISHIHFLGFLSFPHGITLPQFSSLGWVDLSQFLDRNWELNLIQLVYPALLWGWQIQSRSWWEAGRETSVSILFSFDVLPWPVKKMSSLLGWKQEDIKSEAPTIHSEAKGEPSPSRHEANTDEREIWEMGTIRPDPGYVMWTPTGSHSEFSPLPIQLTPICPPHKFLNLPIAHTGTKEPPDNRWDPCRIPTSSQSFQPCQHLSASPKENRHCSHVPDLIQPSVWIPTTNTFRNPTSTLPWPLPSAVLERLP